MVAEVETAEEQFGPYLVYERLGVGGMATVHRALERGIEGFERMVALKRLLPHLAEDASFIKSFVREAKLASLLNHVNIVQIFELGRVGTEYFISMEYIDGKDIRQILRHARKVTGPPPVNITVGLLLQLCDALDYAHNKSDEEGQPLQLVHRDVSPSNVLVTTAGHVKIIDFGIAKAQSSQLRTQTGRVKGKLAYMAPEAVSGGKELDARSDLFAVGVIAHELLTARPLFASKNEYQTLLKVQRGDIMPPSTFNQTCPPELDAIVLKALARERDQRFSSATEVRDELLAMRRQYKLQTGYRDIAAWVEWAFSLEVPTGGVSGQHTLDSAQHSAVLDVKSPVRHTTPRPPTRAEILEEEDAVEIAWGSGAEQESQVGPVVLDDVPDVSEKHKAPSQQLAAADDVDLDLGDDIPTPAPSHGTRSRSNELPAQAVDEATLPGDSTRPRKRSITEPGHTPAPTSSRISGQNETVKTDADGHPLGELVQGGEQTDPDLPAAAESPNPPTVRFKSPSLRPETRPHQQAIQIPPVGAPARSVRTTSAPSVSSPARAAPVSIPPDLAPVPIAAPAANVGRSKPGITSQRLKPKTTAPAIGSALLERERKAPKKAWVIVAGIVAAGACATAVTLYVTRGQDTVAAVSEEPQPRVAPRTVGTVKFNTEPPTANITIEGKLVHSGSPWATELPAGVHQIQIEAKGYKSWLTSLELSAAETQTLRVVLEPLGTASTVAEATLILRSTPSGLDAYLDGELLPNKTPIKMPIKVGPHRVSIKQNGVEVWHQDLNAKASANYEFEPSMDAARQRERVERETQPVAKKPAPQARPPEPEVNRVAERTVAPTPLAPAIVEQPRPAPSPTPSPAPAIRETPPAPPPVAPPAPAILAQPRPAPARVAKAGPVTVPPNTVTKLSGSTPQLGASKNADIPPVIAAKLCIDAAGRVTSADMLTKLQRHTASDFVDAIKTWKYAPYKQAGIETAACFAISFRVK
ncbi:MAG: protein kinase [Deltaproteobacteria bacterium]|nr:protein kinase [Deltaproteobacteria bacterium]